MAYVYIRRRLDTDRYMVIGIVEKYDTHVTLDEYRDLYKHDVITKGVINKRDFDRLKNEFNLPRKSINVPESQNGVCPLNI